MRQGTQALAGKWIRGLKPSLPLADAGRRVLRIRLQTVGDFLEPARERAAEDPEYVHQLRVATRRARAAADIFSPCLPARQFRKTKKLLRNIRRAAGAARDWDVFLLSLPTLKTADKSERVQSGYDCLAGFAAAQRLEAQHVLLRDTPDVYSFERKASRIVHAVRAPKKGDVTLGAWGREVVAELVSELDRAGNTERQQLEQLHRIRIIGKRLRYAMEIFVDCFPPAFRRTHYASIEQMQEILGRLNDSRVTIERLRWIAAQVGPFLGKRWRRYAPAVEQLVKEHEARMPEAVKQFEDWWRRWHADPDLRQSLVRMLEQPAG